MRLIRIISLFFVLNIVAQNIFAQSDPYGEVFRKQGDMKALAGDYKGALDAYAKAGQHNNLIAINRIEEVEFLRTGREASGLVKKLNKISRKRILKKLGMASEDEFYAKLGVDKNQTLYVLMDQSMQNTLTPQQVVAINNVQIQNPQTQSVPTEPEIVKSDVDLNIPMATKNNDKTFAIVIANENYQEVSKVANAINDGTTFAEYCTKSLGMPESNVHLVTDATFINLKREVNWLQQVAEAYNGEAKIIVYYAGHGIPDEKTQTSYLLPVDGLGTDVTTGLSLKDFYSTLSSIPAQSVTVFLDACFSGATRDGGMMAAARGVAIKAKAEAPQGKLVVLSAAQGDETAYPYSEKNHGLFTYYLLKKLQDTKGDVTIGELSEYIRENVSKKSIVVNGKSQTPALNASISLGDSWKEWKLR